MRQRPRKADQLALAHGKSCAAFADVGVDAVAQGIQQGAEPHFAQRGFHTRAADVFVAQADVRFQGAGEQERILQHDAELLAQLVHVVAANVHAIEQNLSALNFVEAQQELNERGLSRAGVADDGQGLSGRDVEGNVAQHPVFILRDLRRRDRQTTRCEIRCRRADSKGQAELPRAARAAARPAA